MPYKISMWIVLFFVFLNGSAVMLGASGTADYLGINPQPGQDDAVQDARQISEGYDTGGGGGSTLFGFYNTLASPLESVFNTIFPGAAMMKNVGVPYWMVNFVFAGLALVPGYDLAIYLRSG